MGNTVFFEKVETEKNRITFKDIFSDCFKKHTKEEIQYAFLAGSPLDSASEANMLFKWQRPWLFFRLIVVGAVFAVITIVWQLIFNFSYIMVFTIVPLIIPIALMIFIWELNIPRNISFGQLMLAFLLGAVLSFMFLGLISFLESDDGNGYISFKEAFEIGLVEEIVKLLAGVLLLFLFSKKHKIYGLTGLVIGAAVGAGFSGFESIQYAFNSGIATVVLRALLAFGGHTLWVAPVIGAIAYHSEDGKITTKSFLNQDFFITFLLAIFLHALWDWSYLLGSGTFNMGDGSTAAYFWIFLKATNPSSVSDFIGAVKITSNVQYFILTVIKPLIVTVSQWIIFLYVLKNSLEQVVKIGHRAAGTLSSGGKNWSPQVNLNLNQHFNGPANNGLGYIDSGNDLHKKVNHPVSGNRITITCIAGSGSGTVWHGNPENGAGVMIGRGTQCRFSMPQDAKGVSRRHCCVSYAEGLWVLQDLGSTYGTRVNGGNPIPPGHQVTLHDSDRIALGGKTHILSVKMD